MNDVLITWLHNEHNKNADEESQITKNQFLHLLGYLQSKKKRYDNDSSGESSDEDDDNGDASISEPTIWR